jgi:hypothetical protein
MRFARKATLVVGLALAVAGGGSAARAEDATTVAVTLNDHRFSPAEPTAPAGKPFVLEVTNLDATPSEFESKVLRVEKPIVGGGKITVRLLPLAPGRYRFYDDYHEATAEGFLVVK